MAFKAYKIKSATFGGTAIVSLQNVSFSENGNAFDIQGDGNLNIEDVFVDSIGMDITIDVEDVSQIDGDAFKVGTAPVSGGLVIVWEERVGSDGAAAGADITATFANVRITSRNLDAPSAGAGNGSITIRAAGPNDAALVVWS